MSLTKYPEGSLKELWKLAFPLMLTSLSAMFMIFVDRLLLAHYSVSAHNAAVAATTLGWGFIFGWLVLGNISEVFVAQYNGAGLLRRMGEPVWQMIWFSLLSWLFFLPLSIWGPEFFYGTDEVFELERQYLGQMLVFGPFYPLSAALTGFFVGQGKTRLITIVVLIANVINIFLDSILIFGVEGIIPSMGVRGAAIATNMATIVETIVLMAFFLNKKHKALHGTDQWQLNWNSMWNCVRVGMPTAIFFTCEILAFAVYYAILAKKGEEYITVAGICQTMLLLCCFFFEGINKATSAVMGNLIGAGRAHLFPKVLSAGFILNLIFFFFLIISFVCGQPLIMHYFLPKADAKLIAQVSSSLTICLLMTAAYLFFDGIRMQFAGLLTAAGDTMFLFVSGMLTVWLLMVMPVYYVMQLDVPVEVAVLISLLYTIAATGIYGFRTWQGKWQSMVLTSQ